MRYIMLVQVLQIKKGLSYCPRESEIESLYEVVYSNSTDYDIDDITDREKVSKLLEQIFADFNLDNIKSNYSMSVGDIIELDDIRYIYSRVGFKKMNQNKIRKGVIVIKKIIKRTLRKIFFPKCKVKTKANSSNIVHLNLQCKSCSKILNTHNGVISAKRKDGSYYVKCSCNFINRIQSNKSYATSTKDTELVQMLFKKNGYDMVTFSYKNGEKHYF